MSVPLSVCTELIPSSSSHLNSRLKSIIQCSLQLHLTQPLSLQAYVGLIHFQWEEFVSHPENTLNQAWNHGRDQVKVLYETLQTIPEAIFGISTLEVKEAPRTHKRKEREESDEKLLYENRQDLEYGMPQIRFLLFCNTKNGGTKDWREIQEILCEKFPIANVSLVDCAKESEMHAERAFERTLSYHSHRWSQRILQESGDGGGTLSSWCCYCTDSMEKVNSFMKSLVESGLVISQYQNSTFSSGLSPTTSILSSTQENRMIDSMFHTKKPYQQFLILAERIFKEYEILYCSRNRNCYVRIQKTEACYQFDKSLSELVSFWSSKEFEEKLVRDSVLPRDMEKQWRYLVMDYASRFLKGIQDTCGDFLPQYLPNYDYVEFKDCFYQISTGECLEEIDEDIICLRYFPMKFEEASQPPTLWLQILENSLSDHARREFCIQYAQLFQEKKRRQKCLYLIGESKCGKSSLLAPLEGIFGLDNIGICGRQLRQSPLEDLVGKKVAIFDEFSTKSISREDFLSLTEGQTMKISVKYRRNPRLEKPIHVIFSANFYPSYPRDESGAIESRLSTFQFYPIKAENIKNDSIIQIKEKEAAQVLLYCNRIYLETKE